MIIRPYYFLIFFLLSVGAHAKAPIHVVTSIQPIALIAAEVLQDTVKLEVLLPSNADPHHFQAKPSQITKLNNADVFFWIGPELERFVPKLLKASPKTHSVPLCHTLCAENDDASHTDEHDDTHISTEHHDHHVNDLHIWMDPNLAIELAEKMVSAVNQIDPTGSPRRLELLKIFKQQTMGHLQKMVDQFDHKAVNPLISYHNAFSHLAHRLSLNILDTISTGTDRKPGAKHLTKINQLINDQDVCFVMEPQTPRVYLKQLNVTRFTEIDPLGRHIKVDSEVPYQQFLTYVTQQLEMCMR